MKAHYQLFLDIPIMYSQHYMTPDIHSLTFIMISPPYQVRDAMSDVSLLMPRWPRHSQNEMHVNQKGATEGQIAPACLYGSVTSIRSQSQRHYFDLTSPPFKESACSMTNICPSCRTAVMSESYFTAHSRFLHPQSPALRKCMLGQIINHV